MTPLLDIGRTREAAQRPRPAPVRVGRLLQLALATLSCSPAAALAACSVAAQGLSFGSYDPLAGQRVDGAGNIAVTCDAGVAYGIALSSGNGPYAARLLASGADSLQYNLYTDASRVLVWGDGTGGTATVAGSGNGTATNVPIYGRIPSGQNVRSGSYGDNIVITVTF